MASVATRSQEAITRMKARAFERIDSRCQLLDVQAACGLLGITEQVLIQEASEGKLLAYTHADSCRTFYPSFQFAENKPRLIVESLIRSLDVDPADTEAMNTLVQHLVGRMDYSDPGEPGSVLLRFEVLDDPAALDIIKRDYRNALMAGQ
ncbi:hypothetical protein [Pseudomonas putida]|uniref:Uncharacterized protein n=1 Tax=Pseudomonas putida TaxID=303 RepID=A0A6I6XU22_PSEPU|nr:hypothetical protein [Pseudomonas putida]QHG63394.2 hypothetical protein C2H86_02725 [Pseudomonas putida]